jgi:CheY-like chemotaxis protein
LEGAGYRVHAAADGRQALDVLARQRIDVIVSDVIMPHMDGIELLSAVRQQHPRLPVLLMTGYISGAHDLPVDQPILLKPFLPRELTKRLAALLPRAAEGAAG